MLRQGAASAARNTVSGRVQAGTSNLAPTSPGSRFLVVEDREADLELITALLRLGVAAGGEVMTAGTLAEAVEMLELASFDSILLDLTLPDADGLEGLRAVRELATETPIIVLTGLRSTELAVAALAAGAQDFLHKDEVTGPSLDRAIRYASERHRTEAELHRTAFYDALTGLPNRTALSQHLAEVTANSASSEQPFAVLFCDISRFHLINDSLGHQAGDVVLAEVAKRIEDSLRDGDFLARYGGDEFAVVIEQVDGPERARQLAARVAGSISDTPIEIDEHSLSIEISAGAVIGDGAADPEMLVRDAVIAVKTASREGSELAFFDPQLKNKSAERFQLEQRLKHAVEQGSFELVYQPLVRAADDEIFAVEALIRWNDPELGMVPPPAFIPVAEDLKMIGRIGTWVRENACSQFADWIADGADPALILNVNVSPMELGDGDYAMRVLETIERHGLEPEQLCIEITEGVLVSDVEGAEERLAELSALGVKIAIDDFGTGFSSLDAVARFPFDYAKLDRSLLNGIADERRRRRFIRGLQALSESLGVATIAEGVETELELEVLCSLGCELVQGYLFSRPESGERVGEMLTAPRASGLRSAV